MGNIFMAVIALFSVLAVSVAVVYMIATGTFPTSLDALMDMF